MQKPYKLFLPEMFRSMIAQKHIEEASHRVHTILQELSLTTDYPISSIVSDPTKAHFSGIVHDSQGKKLFIKIKLFDHPITNSFFTINNILGSILKDHPEFSLSTLTPKYIKGSSDYVLFEAIDGHDLGSRRYIDEFEMDSHELKQVITIFDAIQDFPTAKIPEEFRYSAWEIFLFFMYELTKFHEEKKLFLHYIPEKTLKQLEDLRNNSYVKNLFDTSQNVICHFDFKPGNLVTSNQDLYIVDWDYCCVTNRYIDISFFYHNLASKPVLQEEFLQYVKQKFTDKNESLMLSFWLLVRAFVEIKVLINNKLSPEKKKISVEDPEKIIARNMKRIQQSLTELEHTLKAH